MVHLELLDWHTLEEVWVWVAPTPFILGHYVISGNSMAREERAIVIPLRIVLTGKGASSVFLRLVSMHSHTITGVGEIHFRFSDQRRIFAWAVNVGFIEEFVDFRHQPFPDPLSGVFLCWLQKFREEIAN